VSRFASTLSEWLLVSLGSMLLMALIYPDLLVTAQIRFTAGHDIEIPFLAAFNHASYFIRGEIPLWNLYDQVNHAHLHLGTGFHSFTAIIEGYVFSLIHWMFDRPGEAFQSFHPIVFFTLCTLARTAGGIALLRLYPISTGSRVLALVAMNTLLAQHAYVGVMVGFLYSLTPMILYLIVRFLRHLSLLNLLWLFAGFAFAFAQAPLLAIGYFYLPIHMFIVCAAVAFFIWARRDRRGVPAAPATPGVTAASPALRRWTPPSLAVVLGLVIVAANVAYLLLMLDTFSLETSGLGGGQSEGRFDNILNPLDFLQQRGAGPPPADAFRLWVDFSTNDWWFSWVLIGAGCLALSVIGLIYGNHRERWLFAIAFILDLLVQFPRDYLSWGLPAHYITSFTNPFAFLIRHSHMSMLLMGYFLVPLIAFGSEVLRGRSALGPAAAGRLRLALAAVLLIAAAGYCLFALSLLAALVTAAVFLIAAASLVALRYRPRAAAAVGFVPAVLLTVDLAGFSEWLSKTDYTADRIQPRSFTGLVADPGLDPNPIVLDYANPATRHIPLFVRTEPVPVTPTTDPEFPTDFAVYFVRQVYMGKFFETVFMARHLEFLANYELRHKRYALVKFEQTDTLPEFGQILTGDDRLFYFAPVGIDAEKLSVKQLVDAGAEKWAVSLTIPPGATTSGPLADALPDRPPPLPDGETASLGISFGLDEAQIRQRDGFAEYAFALPPDFPGFLASTVLGPDARRVHAFIGERPLAPAQGRLIRPFTFDLRNVATDALVVALPDDQPASGEVRLEVTQSPLVASVDSPSGDRLALQITAPQDGWLVWRNPLDDGWSASVNGTPATPLAANQIAMAVPVRAGNNEVVFEYAAVGRYHRYKLLILAMIAAVPLLGAIMIGAALVLQPPADRRAPKT
jgi:hypothetical protein